MHQKSDVFSLRERENVRLLVCKPLPPCHSEIAVVAHNSQAKMSLGWQTESAILPGKVRPIKVGDKSILSLKALMHEKEQQKLAKSGASSSSFNPKKNKSKLTDTLANKNESKAKRQARDEEAEAELRAQTALAAKAKLYEDIMAGKVRTASSLIDFRSKQKQTDKDSTASANYNQGSVVGGSYSSSSLSSAPPLLVPPTM
ncbi:hypothetical protein EON65_17485, partial [archaeon]